MTITEDMQAAILQVPEAAWTPAYDSDGEIRDGAWVADISGMLNLSSWPARMRMMVRKERPHPGPQLRFTDIDGHWFTAFVTDATKGQLADLELRHRRRARCEDRIRCGKDTGLRCLPLSGFAWRRAGHGPRRSPPRSPGCRPSHPADQPEQPQQSRKETTRDLWNPVHPARQPGSQARALA